MRSAALRKPAFEPLYVSADRVILIRGRHYNVNLRELYEATCGPWRGEKVQFFLAPGARILSRRSDLPAVCTGYWPPTEKGNT